MPRLSRSLLTAAFLGALATACTDLPTNTADRESTLTPSAANQAAVASDNDIALFSLMAEANAQLDAAGAPFRVSQAEYLAGPGAEEIGRTLFFSDRGNKQLSSDFVPNDPRRSWNTGVNQISYLVDQSRGATNDGLDNADTEAAIDRAMATWAAEQCADFDLTKAVDTGVEASALLGGPGFLADVVHAGWLPAGVLGPNTLGVTFTLIWVSNGTPTDIDNDGKTDVAWREIFYNDAFTWRIGPHIDVETVALHEAGHGLSQGHFGELFRTDANGFFHFAPLAVMNAGYTQVQQVLQGTDRSGHCSNWGGWGS